MVLEKQFNQKLNNPGTFVLKQNRFKGHLVYVFNNEKKAVIHKAANRVTDFDE